MSDYNGAAFLNKVFSRIIFCLWVLACLYVLLAFWGNPSAGMDGEIGILFHLRMLVLTFPVGFLAGYASGGISMLLTSWGYYDYVSEYMHLATWLLMFVSGAFQWFWLFPKLVKLSRDWLQRQRGQVNV